MAVEDRFATFFSRDAMWNYVRPTRKKVLMFVALFVIGFIVQRMLQLQGIDD